MADERSIDVFCHCLPPAFLDAVARSGAPPIMFERARAIPAMSDADARRRVVEAFPGYQQILSLASPTIESLAPADDSPALARVGNDAMADWVARWPDLYVGFVASLPMNALPAAAREAERAIGSLDAVGIQIYTNVLGAPLDRPEFLELLGHLASLGRPVWLHPIRPMTVPDYAGEPCSKFDLWWAFGWPYETSLAMGRLAFAGVFDRWPGLKIITHHVGGIVPMMEGRLGPGMELLGTRAPAHLADANRTELREPPLAAFRRFLADTASFGSRAAIECGRAFFGVDHLLFGTDMPFDPEQGPGFIRSTLQAIADMDLTAAERRAILSGNAERLLGLGANHA